MMLPSPKTAAAVLLLAATLAACGGNATADDAPLDATNASQDARATIDVTDFMFEPEQLHISAGTTVTFTNRDRFGHTATSGMPGAATDDFDVVLGMTTDADTTGMSGTQTFDEPGTFAYFCRYHPSMTATIVVD